MTIDLKAGLEAAGYPGKLIDELLQAHAETKRNFHLGGLRLSAVEGGRFCEAAFRMLQQLTTGTFTPLGQTLKTDPIITALANVPNGQQPDSIRLHIPRALRTVYDVRNNRDAAHLADEIDPNLQDATLVVSNIDWVLAEFVRLHHNIKPNEAQSLINSIVSRQTPMVQDFGGFLKVLGNLGASDHLLLQLYCRGDLGATLKELSQWARTSMRRNLKRTLARLVDDQAFAHFDGQTYKITFTGQREVERQQVHSS